MKRPFCGSVLPFISTGFGNPSLDEPAWASAATTAIAAVAMARASMNVIHNRLVCLLGVPLFLYVGIADISVATSFLFRPTSEKSTSTTFAKQLRRWTTSQKSLLDVFSFDLVQHGLERLRPHP